MCRVGRILSLTPHETAFERNKKSVFTWVCRLSKSGKCLQIGVTVSRFSLGRGIFTNGCTLL